MPNNPVQIILNSKDFLTVPEIPGGGGSKDFFEGRDQEFVAHKTRLQKQLASIDTAFQKSAVKTGFVKVTLRKGAWAKTHRPNQSLFPDQKRPCIGASRLGELYYMVAADDLKEISNEVARAEDTPKLKVDEKTGESESIVTPRRSEVGAIEAIELPSASDKRTFSAAEAVRWLSDPRTGGMYFVEVFAPKAEDLMANPFVDKILQSAITSSTRDNLSAALLKAGLESEVLPIQLRRNDPSRIARIMGVRLKKDSLDPTEHQRLLTVLEEQLFVRQISLPPVITESTTTTSSASAATPIALPPRQPGTRYAKVGIIDGGISSYYASWIIGSHSPVAENHLDTSHADFIAGLLVAGQALNGSTLCSEPDGCDLYDIRLLPKEASYSIYYPNGVADFFQELAIAVETAKQQGVRVFNMSLNLETAVADLSYGAAAEMLDQIADEHEVLIIVSAGNLEPSDRRSDWPPNPEDALKMLAERTTPETIFQPAESARCLSVGAINPPGFPPHVPGAPTVYTRRGPGMRVGLKPDLAHYGGSTHNSKSETGLKSCDSSGKPIHDLGTSYASPLVSKGAASLEANVVSELSRDTLSALLVHHANIPASLDHDLIRDLARQFVGFGLPVNAKSMLETPDHEITMVFSDVIRLGHQLQFDFAWPQSLVKAASACAGKVRLTLAYRPPLDARFGSEFVRVNLDAHLRQENKGEWKGRLKQILGATGNGNTEAELIRHGLKWWPLKRYENEFKIGVGTSSNWRLIVQSVVRAGENFPKVGIPFTAILTISDHQAKEPVFNQMKAYLLSTKVQIADIRTAAQVRSRIT
jgi:hypothetical protein